MNNIIRHMSLKGRMVLTAAVFAACSLSATADKT